MIKSIEDLDSFFLSYMPSGGRSGEIRENRLKRMAELLKALGNPEKDFKSIHVAGSKGKGSTSSIIAFLLEKSGHSTGVFLSPHVYSLLERFKKGDGYFPLSSYFSCAEVLEEKVKDLSFSPTTFELYTAYSYLLFSREKVEYAVIETGLGGRIDSTNTISSFAEVLLAIELEHTEILGSTIKEIATEKSKIIKENTDVFFSENSREALDVFMKEAEDKNCRIHSFSSIVKDFEYDEKKEAGFLAFSIDGERFEIRTSLRSLKMMKNIALSVLTLKRLSLLERKSLDYLSSFTIPGRFEERKRGEKKIVLDVAHTEESILNCASTFSSLYKRKRCLIFSAIKGKNYKAMIDILARYFDTMIFTKTIDFKKSDPDEIMRYASSAYPEKKLYVIPDAKDALEKAKENADDILIAGSFYLITEYKDA